MIRATNISQAMQRRIDDVSEWIWQRRIAGRAVFLLSFAVAGIVASRYGR